MDKIPDLNLFMMCERPVVRAFRPIKRFRSGI